MEIIFFTKTKIHQIVRHILLFVAICFAVSPLSAQREQVFKYGIPEGLSHQVVTQVFQDKHGFIWAGTQNGLNRFDGYEFVQYFAGDSSHLTSSYIRCIGESQSGKLLVGVENGGLNVFDWQTERFSSFSLPINTDNSVTTVLSLNEKEVLCGSNTGLFLINLETGDVTAVCPKKITGSVHATTKTAGQQAYIGADNGLFLLNINTLTCSESSLLEDIDSPVLSICLMGKDSVLAGTETGLFMLTGNAENRKLASFLPFVEITSILQKPDGDVVVGTFGSGIITISKTGKLRREETRMNAHILSWIRDESGVIWAGTYGEGLLRVVPMHSAFHFVKSTSQKNQSAAVYAICETEYANYAGTEMGLTRIGKDSMIYIEPDRMKGPVYALLVDKSLTLWIGKTKGVLQNFSINAITTRFSFNESKIGDGDVLALAVDAEDRLWAGTTEGIIQYTNENGKAGVVQTMLQDRKVRHIETSVSGEMQLATDGGVYLSEPGNPDFTLHGFFKENKNRDLQNVYCIASTSSGDLIAGTDGGLVLLTSDTAIVFDVKSGLPDPAIFGILKENDGVFWLSTNKGLVRLELMENQKVVFTKYGRNKLPMVAFNHGACYRNDSGIMSFGGSEGVVSFNPAEVVWNTRPPKVVITGIDLFFKPIHPYNSDPVISTSPVVTNGLKLNYKQNVLRIGFAATDYIDPAGNTYAYMLENLDKDWTYIRGDEKPFATYPYIPPGDYTFKVKAANSDGVWNDDAVSLKISINPPFYQTKAFYVVSVAILLLLIWLLIIGRTKRLKAVQRILEKNVEERTAELTQRTTELESALDTLKKAQSQLIDAEKMASLGQLTAGVAHEINNPINFVSGNTGPLKRDIDELLLLGKKYEEIIAEKGLGAHFVEAETLKLEMDYVVLLDEINRLIAGIDEGARRTAEIVRSLRNFSRLDENELKSADIHEGIESTLMILHNKMKSRITVVKDFGNIPRIQCYPGKLNQAFMNILTNAVQAIDGEGTITIRTIMRNNKVEISIKDTGKGMTEAQTKRIFEPFYTTKEVGKGTGLGLYITFSIIEKHNGSIRVTSEPGKGTEFVVVLRGVGVE
ncbi:MAG: ATP-binding protein [Bacteroidetes bacterium]|nr:ATP-binding protein [Bacteroidota bacterium]MBU1720152.1 ATP-binding protein [Bacteroidota bacterium]